MRLPAILINLIPETPHGMDACGGWVCLGSASGQAHGAQIFLVRGTAPPERCHHRVLRVGVLVDAVRILLLRAAVHLLHLEPPAHLSHP